MNTTPEPTAQEVREHLAYMLCEVRSMQGTDGLLAVRRAYRVGDVATAETHLRRVEELFRICEVMIETVRWPEAEA
jgi:hypothetical protein